jgi:tetratricopeptide (TPR) repeat protein
MRPALSNAVLWVLILVVGNVWCPCLMASPWNEAAVLAQASDPAQPPSVIASRDLANDARRDLGRLEYLAAAGKARRAIELDPNNAMACAVLGVASLYTDDPGAKDAIQQALRIDDKLALAHVGQGICYFRQAISAGAENRNKPKGEAERLLRLAEAEFKTAVETDPREAAAHDGLGGTYFQQGRLDAAVKEFQEATKQDPHFPTAYFNLGNVWLTRKDWSRAEEAYRQAIRIQGQNAYFHVQLAAVLLVQGRRIEAQREADEAKRLGLSSSPVYNELEGRK